MYNMDEIKQRRNVLFTEFRTHHPLNRSVLFIIYRLLSLSCGLNHDTYTESMTDATMDTVGLVDLTVSQREQVRSMCHTFRNEFNGRVDVIASPYTVTYKWRQQTTVE
jgi:hypothetical protein